MARSESALNSEISSNGTGRLKSFDVSYTYLFPQIVCTLYGIWDESIHENLLESKIIFITSAGRAELRCSKY